ncbi:XRE family transcriptional regulator [Streptomyces sp. TRM68416]|uniref:helix-turn-helix domain-containing protein n=1 Tax=Streptomyces sp. TRM68416 TaxID=2758412 RepID=UPI002948C4AA|nr:DUF2690 domain-containing protein [Streptomyces sp. TRM68416]
MTYRNGPEHSLLVRELTALRRRTGLSLDGLARRTTASRSSWHRYLNGAVLPPRALVQELCALADEPPARLLALWDLAAEAGRRSPATPPPPKAPEAPKAPETPEADHPRPAPSPSAKTGPRETPSSPSAKTDQRETPPPPSAKADPRETPPPAKPGRRLGPRRHGPRRLGPRRLLPAAALVGSLALTAVLTGVGLLHDSGSQARPDPEPLRPGCVGTGCTGRSSQPQACTIAGSGTHSVAERRPARGPSMDIRYSPFCKASWARIWFGRIGDRVEISAPGQGTHRAEIRDRFDAEGYLSTPMVGGGPEGMTACLIVTATAERHCLTT